MTRVADLVIEARRRLAEAPFQPSRREARLLLGRVLDWTEAQVLAHGDTAVPPDAVDRFRELLDRRLGGEPVAYLLGEREFYGRVFRVDRRVLIPRPETEHLVEAALAAELPPRPRVLDVGTGSGCVAVTLALERPDFRVTATDLSLEALAVAAGNARRLGARVGCVATDLAAALDPRAFDLVMSNPPYVDRADAGTLSPEVRDFEPPSALYAREGGAAELRRLLELGRNLHQNAVLAMEIGFGQLATVLGRAAAGPFDIAEVRHDYSGIPRVVVLTRR
jgi:release factor glutamine methyltransferase